MSDFSGIRENTNGFIGNSIATTENGGKFRGTLVHLLKLENLLDLPDSEFNIRYGIRNPSHKWKEKNCL